MRAARNFEGSAWVSYDVCYRRKAAQCRDLCWSQVFIVTEENEITCRTWEGSWMFYNVVQKLSYVQTAQTFAVHRLKWHSHGG